MSITKGNGGYIIDALVKESSGLKYLETKQYIYYTKAEAIREFKGYLAKNNLVLA